MSFDEEISFWIGEETEEAAAPGDDPLLPHLTDQKIRGLGDSYDDPRVDSLIHAYISLRVRVQRAVQVLLEGPR